MRRPAHNEYRGVRPRDPTTLRSCIAQPQLPSVRPRAREARSWRVNVGPGPTVHRPHPSAEARARSLPVQLRMRGSVRRHRRPRGRLPQSMSTAVPMRRSCSNTPRLLGMLGWTRTACGRPDIGAHRSTASLVPQLATELGRAEGWIACPVLTSDRTATSREERVRVRRGQGSPTTGKIELDSRERWLNTRQ